MIHLDTHVVVWLYAGDQERLSAKAIDMINAWPALVSPMVRLELSLLHELGRISVPAPIILDRLQEDLGLRVAESTFRRVAAIAGDMPWTRDPFDRLIAAHAVADDAPLITRDSRMLAHCPVAVWD